MSDKSEKSESESLSNYQRLSVHYQGLAAMLFKVSDEKFARGLREKKISQLVFTNYNGPGGSVQRRRLVRKSSFLKLLRRRGMSGQISGGFSRGSSRPRKISIMGRPMKSRRN